jgi:CheY-like chemotaxis protein
MPGLDGIELAKRVRTLGGYAGPIIITSGRLGSDEIEELTESHVDVILNKPFLVEELLEATRKALGARR